MHPAIKNNKLYPFNKKCETMGTSMILCVYFWVFGTPQYHPPEADKSAGATPVKWALPFTTVNFTGQAGQSDFLR